LGGSIFFSSSAENLGIFEQSMASRVWIKGKTFSLDYRGGEGKPQDHEGGGYLRVHQVKGNEWVPVSEWMRGYRDETMALVRSMNKK
jgi:hypothetical protein